MDKDLLEVIHETIKSFHDVRLVDLKTMREFDIKCLPKIPKLNSVDIKRLRLKERVSQSVFAKCLNISTSTVQKWERGEKHPGATALKLLYMVEQKGLKSIAI